MAEWGVVDNSALSLNSYDVGAGKTWVHIPAAHQKRREVAIKEVEWTTLMHIIKEHVNDMYRTMCQQMTEAWTRN